MVMRSSDRQVILEPDGNKKNLGVFDPRVLEGKNRLRIIQDGRTLLWSFKYDHGVVPSTLKDRYPSFNAARQAGDIYFKAKGLRIKEIVD